MYDTPCAFTLPTILTNPEGPARYPLGSFVLSPFLLASVVFTPTILQADVLLALLLY